MSTVRLRKAHERSPLPLDDTDDTTRELLARSELLSRLRLDQFPFCKDLVILTLIFHIIILKNNYS